MRPKPPSPLKGELVALALLACACSSPSDDPTYGEPGELVCDDGIPSPVILVDRQVATVGESVNSLRRFGDDAYVVESGSNTVAKLDLATGARTVHVDVGNERGPWEVWASEDELWITNYIANTVTIADRATGAVIDEISHPAFAQPSAITGTTDRVYVGNVEFAGTNDFGPGHVTVIDRETREVFGSIATQKKNPQHLEVVELSDGPRVVVVDSGAFLLDDGAFAGSDAAVEIWTETEEPLEPEVSVAELPLVDNRRVGSPGRPLKATGSDTLYFASGTGPFLFSLDAARGTWLRGSDDPIVIAQTTGDSLNHGAIDERGVIYITAFNEDALYLVDTTCDEVLAGPIPLEESSMLAGPYGLIPVERGDGRVDAFFVLSHAHELGRVRLRYE